MSMSLRTAPAQCPDPNSQRLCCSRNYAANNVATMLLCLFPSTRSSPIFQQGCSGLDQAKTMRTFRSQPRADMLQTMFAGIAMIM